MLTKELVKPSSPPIRSKNCFKRIFYNRLFFFSLNHSCARAHSFTLKSTVPFILLTSDNTYVRYCTIILFFLVCSIVIENLFKRMQIVTSTYVPIIFYHYIFYFTFVSSIEKKNLVIFFLYVHIIQKLRKLKRRQKKREMSTMNTIKKRRRIVIMTSYSTIDIFSSRFIPLNLSNVNTYH